MPELSLIIPAYNEEELITDTLEKAVKHLKKQKNDYEILVVNDGSVDRTANLVEEFYDKRVKLISLGKNQGKGAALKAGFEKATGKYIVFTDADLSVPIEYLSPLLKSLKRADVAIGTRRSSKSEIVIHQPFLRESLGRIFTKLTQIFTGTKLTDYTCGFKGFTGEAGKHVFSRALVDRWAYDAEILFLANKLGYKISEVPVEWHNRADTRVSLWSAVFESLRDLFLLRVRDFLGKYER